MLLSAKLSPFASVNVAVPVNTGWLSTVALNSKSVSNNKTTYFFDLTNELIEYFENNINKMFRNERDIAVAYAIVELLNQIDEIENFNKKALYLFIREMTGVNTNNITKIVNVMKVHYRKVLNEFNTRGTVNIRNKNTLFDF